MDLFTIGFTQKSAQEFFGLLRKSGARYLIDIRLNNNSQLAGFTKKDDLQYFLFSLVNMKYHELKILAPEESILKEYRRTKDWKRYELSYNQLIQERQIEKYFPEEWIKEGSVLLCSESRPEHCHRKLAAEYLAKKLSTDINIIHL